MKVATILDEFSEMCFAPEFDLIRLRQNDYIQKINSNPDIKFLLVESAWRGSGKSWSLATARLMRNIKEFNNFKNLLYLAKSKKIPRVFWNKEDPAHYKDFLSIANMFDYIFTTDFSSIANYKRDLKRGNIYTLPFAAQPKLHYPNDLTGRLGVPCFAGTYWSKLHKRRAADMGHIISPAIPYGLHIYDRNKLTGSGEKWPKIYSPCIKGGLPYEKLVDAYRKYRVFMNVNCIVNSPTMFSRRVFELLACGTPVVSAYALGIEKMLPSVYLSRDLKKTKECITNLLHNDNMWNAASVKGIRAVYGKNTYTHRFTYICKVLGLDIPEASNRKLEAYKRIAEMDPFDYNLARDLAKNA